MKRLMVAILVSLAAGSAVQAASFNTEAMKNMQQQGQNMAAQAMATKAYKLPSGKCLQTQGDPAKAGAGVATADCNESAGQKWRLDDKGRLVNQAGKCLGLSGANPALQDCSEATTQKWKPDDKSRLVSGGGKCLAAVDPTKAGAPVQAMDCNTTPNQVWK